MKKKNFAIFEIVCYVVAAVLGVVALYMAYENIAYINEYAAAYGATFADLGGQAIQSVISAFVPYFAYAFIVLGIGRIYSQVAAPKCAAADVVDAEEVVEAEEAVEMIAAPAEEVACEETVEAVEPACEETAEAVEVVCEEAPAAEAEEQKEA